DAPMPWENFSWRPTILPYIDSNSLRDRVHFDLPPLDPLNLEIGRVQLSLFQCPETPDSLRRVDALGPSGTHSETLGFGACDYSAVHDVANSEPDDPLPAAWHAMHALDVEDTLPAGVTQDRNDAMIRVRPANMRRIGDGLSRTALLVEQAGKPLKYDRTKQSEEVTPTEGAWATAEFSSFYAGGINDDNLSGVYGFHEGAMVAMGDASVHLFAEEMEVEVLTALLTRDGDEIIDANDWQ
ncbi:DUF1559 domain-containing protein, partial [Pirellulales bacterium]|nr:DUF1559 domain-containing protein [Pirellulales bacterium]